MYDLTRAPGRKIKTARDMIRVLKPKRYRVTDNPELAGFNWDSRTIKEGEVYLAIPGQRVDGHRFIPEARARGAAICLVSSFEGLEDTRNCILVDNTVTALGYLAACHRRALPTRIIGLTGSVGKTTTKEILYTLLSVVCRARKSEDNLNSTIGLPTQLLKLEEQDEWMVAEMGMSTPGEIKTLMEMARPDVGMWLSVHAVHQANFPDINAIAAAKAELVEHLGEDKTLVYNMDDPLVVRYGAGYPGRKITYALLDPEADFRARIEPFPEWEGTNFELFLGNHAGISMRLPLVGRFNVANALAACAAAVATGFPVTELSYAMKTVVPTRGRCNLSCFDGDIKLVDDTYNANPHAVRNLLRCYASLALGYHRWLILGDMLELGPDEGAVHYDLGKTIAGYDFDRVTLVGPLSAHTYEALKRNGNPSLQLEHFENTGEALTKMDPKTPISARIWCKASRGIHLEHIAHRLITHFDETRGGYFAF